MAAAAPPVSDCGCSSSSSTTPSTGDGLYPLHGILDPNAAGVVPPHSLDLIWEYQQWVDAIAGPPFAYFWWNPNTSTWM